VPDAVDEPNFAALRHSLSRRRADRRWTYDTLAEASGVSRRTLISIETGKTRGSLESWYRIARALEVDLGELLRPLSRGREPRT
jgi:transcriptional regulator with XRE-family HTH domain